jgi:glyoxylase I family protein
MLYFMPASSLIGQLPLAAIWLRCKDVEESKRFYSRVLGLKIIPEASPVEKSDGKKNGHTTAHFDLGTVRLSLIPREENGKNGGQVNPTQGSQQLVFVVENSIEAVQADLVKRGVKMKSKKVMEGEIGKTTWFTDPDGHPIYLWQPPKRETKNFEEVKDLVDHYESVSRAVADLRQIDAELGDELEKEHSPN